MASPLNAALCALLAVAFWSLLGYAVGRRLLPRPLATGGARPGCRPCRHQVAARATGNDAQGIRGAAQENQEPAALGPNLSSRPEPVAATIHDDQRGLGAHRARRRARRRYRALARRRHELCGSACVSLAGPIAVELLGDGSGGAADNIEELLNAFFILVRAAELLER